MRASNASCTIIPPYNVYKYALHKVIFSAEHIDHRISCALFPLQSGGDQERKYKRRRGEYYSIQTSLIVAALKKLLPIGLNMCTPGDQELISLAKIRYSLVRYIPVGSDVSSYHICWRNGFMWITPRLELHTFFLQWGIPHKFFMYYSFFCVCRWNVYWTCMLLLCLIHHKLPFSVQVSVLSDLLVF